MSFWNGPWPRIQNERSLQILEWTLAENQQAQGCNIMGNSKSTLSSYLWEAGPKEISIEELKFKLPNIVPIFI